MKKMMAICIVAVIYSLYVVLGIYKHFPVAYLDWIDPYTHYASVEWKEAMIPLALPCVIFGLAGMGWYRKSMLGDP